MAHKMAETTRIEYPFNWLALAYLNIVNTSNHGRSTIITKRFMVQLTQILYR